MNEQAGRIYEFGAFRLDAEEHTLWRGERFVSLKPRIFDLLSIFVQSGGRVLTKEKLMQRVWHDCSVTPHNLTVNVHELRKILDKSGDECSHIETIPRRRYRFVAEVREVSRVSTSSLAESNAEPSERRYTKNAEAHQSYLKGRCFLNQRTPAGFEKSIEFFTRAIEIDANYAFAYTGLADAYKLFSTYSALPPKEFNERAKAAASKALEIDETLAEAHIALALIKYRCDWNWLAAEEEYRRTIELNPKQANAHHMYGMYLTAAERFDEALASLTRAQELDPLSLNINAAVGSIFYFSRQYGQALEQLRQTLELDAHFTVACFFLGRTYEQLGEHQKAIAEYKKLINRVGQEPLPLSSLGHVYAASGKKGEARKILNKLEELAAHRYVSHFFRALIYAGGENHDQAFECLERAYAEQDEELSLLKIDPRLDKLRADARFKSLLQRVGLK